MAEKTKELDLCAYAGTVLKEAGYTQQGLHTRFLVHKAKIMERPNACDYPYVDDDAVLLTMAEVIDEVLGEEGKQE